MTDPADIDEDLEEVLEQAYDKLAKAGSEMERISAEDDFNRNFVRLEKQKFWLRWTVCVVALLVVIGLSFLEWRILCYLMFSFGEPSDLFVVLAVSPIAAVTAITIALLIGVFRGFRGNEMDGTANTASKLFGGNGSDS